MIMAKREEKLRYHAGGGAIKGVQKGGRVFPENFECTVHFFEIPSQLNTPQ